MSLSHARAVTEERRNWELFGIFCKEVGGWQQIGSNVQVQVEKTPYAVTGADPRGNFPPPKKKINSILIKLGSILK